jgi:hypothetical protein
MTADSILGVLSVLAIAAAPNLPVSVAGWLLAGGAMAAAFYQPAFAALTRCRAPGHVRVLTIVTLAGDRVLPLQICGGLLIRRHR